MSKRDQDFAKQINLNQIKLAEILGRCRQTISKGLNGASDYFQMQDIEKILSYYAKSNPLTCAFIKTVATNLYPEFPTETWDAITRPYTPSPNTLPAPSDLLEILEGIKNATDAESIGQVNRRAVLLYEKVVRGEITLRNKAGAEIVLFDTEITNNNRPGQQRDRAPDTATPA
ncbi:MAG TPA: hypothetical protein VFR09_06005 [Alphaproteobacteria bacterium]|nr:hypothetical protein [Alphaproteobacteria bacterium]